MLPDTAACISQTCLKADVMMYKYIQSQMFVERVSNRCLIAEIPNGGRHDGYGPSGSNTAE